MIRSMTGYARHEHTADTFTLTWEARSVNHRFLEVAFRLPEELRGREAAWRTRVAERLGRGKVDLGLRIGHRTDAPPALSVNEPLLQRVLGAARCIGEATGRPGELPSISELLRWPGIVDEPPRDTDALAAAARDALDATLDALVDSRAREGERLAAMLEQRCAGILEHAGTVRRRMPELREPQLQRLRQRVARLGAEVDADRLEQELALLVARQDVDEELDRLESHVTEIRGALALAEPVGRRLDFLIQELNREANTLASKAADAEVTRAAVELKVLIEQMREQVQNVE